MDNEESFLNPPLHPIQRSLPSCHHLLLWIQEVPSHPQSRLHPPTVQPGRSQTPAVLSLPLCLLGPTLFKRPHERAPLWLPPPRVADEHPLPTTKKTPPCRRTCTPHPSPTRRPHALSTGFTRSSPTWIKRPPPRTHEKDLPSPPGPSQQHAPPRLGCRCAHTHIL